MEDLGQHNLATTQGRAPQVNRDSHDFEMPISRALRKFRPIRRVGKRVHWFSPIFLSSGCRDS